MLNPPAGTTALEYNSAILDGSSTHVRMTFANGIVLDDQDIDSSGLTVNDILNGETNLTFGRSVMKEFKVNLLNSSRMDGIRWTDEFKLEFGVDINSVTKWVTVGYFTGKRPDKIHYVNVIEFTACDRMQKFDTPANKFLSEITYPKTFAQILSALCAYVGITYELGNELNAIKSRSFNDGFVNGEGLTCRGLLELMAEACGCYARITADGKLKMVWFDTASYSVTADSEFAIDAYDIGEGMTWQELSAYTWEEAEQFTWAEVGGYHEVFKIAKLQVKQTEDDIGASYGSLTGNTYTIVDNPFLAIVADADADTYIKPIWDRLVAFGGYLPMSVECIGNWLVETGDIITVDVNGNSVQLPIFERVFQWNGGCFDSYVATGEIDRPAMTSDISEKLSNGSKYHIFRNEIDELYSEIGDAEGNITTLQQTTSGLTTRVGNAEGNITTLQQTTTKISATVEQKSRVFYSSTTPTGTTADPVETGDYWIDTANNNVTKRYNGSSWVDVSFDDPDKYTVRSGIAITASGVDVTGGKYVKISSGGTFEVDATNFKIDSTNKKLEAGNWTISNNGLLWADNTVQAGNMDSFLISFSNNEIGVSIHQKGFGDTYGFNISSDGSIIPKENLGVVNETLGSSSKKWDRGYFDTVITNTLKASYLASASSKEVKHDIKPMGNMGKLIDDLKPVTYRYNNDTEDKLRYGLIHEETIKVMPEICIGDQNAKAEDKAINYLELVPILLKEVQELRVRVKELEHKMDLYERG